MRVRCVLSDGMRGVGVTTPVPASLFVSVDLGHAFRGMGIAEQRRAIEAGLTDALALALAKLDALHASANVPNPASVRHDREDPSCLPTRAEVLATEPLPSGIAVA